MTSYIEGARTVKGTTGGAAIRVVIVEDHAMVAQGLRAALEAQPDLTVIGLAGSLQEGLRAVASAQPDVVLMDSRLPDGDGSRAAGAVQDAAPGAAVLVVTADAGPDVAAAALSSGAAGLVVKGATVEEVVDAIRSVHRGEGVFSQEALAAALRPKRRDMAELTQRELEILHLLHAGVSTTQIARDLVVSIHTVRNHIRNLTAKLGARTRLEALARAREQGLLEQTTPP